MKNEQLNKIMFEEIVECGWCWCEIKSGQKIYLDISERPYCSINCRNAYDGDKGNDFLDVPFEED